MPTYTHGIEVVRNDSTIVVGSPFDAAMNVDYLFRFISNLDVTQFTFLWTITGGSYTIISGSLISSQLTLEFLDIASYTISVHAQYVLDAFSSDDTVIANADDYQAQIDFTYPPLITVGMLVDLTVSPSLVYYTDPYWEYSDNTYGSGTPTTHIFSIAGLNKVQLRVSTVYGYLYRFHYIMVEAGNMVADFSYSPSSPIVGQLVNFSDLYPGQEQYAGFVREWDIDGYLTSVRNPSYVFISSGSKNVTLTVQSTNSGVATITKVIVVGEATPTAQGLSLLAPRNMSIDYPNLDVILNVSNTNGDYYFVIDSVVHGTASLNVISSPHSTELSYTPPDEYVGMDLISMSVYKYDSPIDVKVADAYAAIEVVAPVIQVREVSGARETLVTREINFNPVDLNDPKIKTYKIYNIGRVSASISTFLIENDGYVLLDSVDSVVSSIDEILNLDDFVIFKIEFTATENRTYRAKYKIKLN